MSDREPEALQHLPRTAHGMIAENESNSHDSSAHLSNETFRHNPLKDSSAFLRLLKLAEETGPSDMKFELRAWPADKAPCYNAISYTWGEDITRTIQVNDQALQIRGNCYEALQQAISYDSDTYLWIDSICIDQENLVEKSEQVHGMYKIYKNALHVLACVGGHADESEWLLHYCDLVLGPDESKMLSKKESAPRPPKLDVPEIALAFAQSTHRDTIARMRSVAVKFAHRPYWNRLWIVQEILAGSQSLCVLYGNTSLSWWQFSAMVDVVLLLTPATSKEQDMRQTPLRKLMHIKDMCEFYGGTVRLSQLLHGLSETICTDPRDRIFGLVAIVDWKSMDLVPIVPDYERTAWSLAVQLTSCLGAQSCNSAMSMLKIDSDVPEMRCLVEERSSPHFVRKNDVETQDFDFGEVTATHLFEDDHGRLRVHDTAKLQSRSEDEALFTGSCGLMIVSEGRLDVGIKPRKVFSNLQDIILVCGETLSGDYLITSLAWKRMCFIFRPTRSSNLDVIGTGVVVKEREYGGPHNELSSALPSEATEDFKSTFVADLHFSTTPEDVMLFFHMDSATEITGEQANVELNCLVFSPMLASKGTARLTVRN